MSGRNWRKQIVEEHMELCFLHLEEFSEEERSFIEKIKSNLIDDHGYANRMDTEEYNKLHMLVSSINYPDPIDEVEDEFSL